MPDAAAKPPEDEPTKPETPNAMTALESAPGPIVTAPRAKLVPDPADNKPILIDDGHRWQTVWRSADGKREGQQCQDQGVFRWRDGTTWTTAPVAPWVAKDHVTIHAKATAAANIAGKQAS